MYSGHFLHKFGNKFSNKVEEGYFKEDASEYPHDVSSSSSIDRSSIGSIPWADDSIKQNQLDWERVERMLRGEETPDEPELKREIEEWQIKFKLKKYNAEEAAPHSDRSNADIENLSNLSLNSLDADDTVDTYDEFAAPNQNIQPRRKDSENRIISARSFENGISSVGNALYPDKDLRLRSVPPSLRQRQSNLNDYRRNNMFDQSGPSALSAVFMSAHGRPTISHRFGKTNNSAVLANKRALMPPILNIPDTKRSFCAITDNNNMRWRAEPSNITYENISVWHLPLNITRLGDRQSTSRNSVVLPAIDAEQFWKQNITEGTSIRKHKEHIPQSTWSTKRPVPAAQNYSSKYSSIYLPVNTSKYTKFK